MALTLSSIVVCMATTVLATPTVPSPVLAADDSCLADGSCALNALQARVTESALENRSLLTARLPNCKCPGGKSAKCGCEVNGGVGCCQWETCYPKKSCGDVPNPMSAVDATVNADPAPASGATVAAAAGCSSASLLQTQYNCEVSTYSSWEYSKKLYCCKAMLSPPTECSIVNANPVGPPCCGVLQQTAVAAGCSASLLQHTIPGGGMVSKTAGAATSATVAAGSAATSATVAAANAAASATGSYFVIQQTGQAAGCTFQHSENTACCQSLRQAAGTAGCSLSLSAVDATVRNRGS